jgi:hypothetical protein
MLAADPNLSRRMAPLLIAANDKMQMAFTNSAVIASNNKKIVSGMIASNEYNPNILGAMFSTDGSLRDVNSAYKALAKSGYPMSFGTFAENYADVSEEYKANYVNFAQNKTGYRPVGTGGDGQYISNYVTGVADPKKFMSPTTIGFIGAMNEDVNTYTSIGSRGYLFGTIPMISLVQKATQSQGNGITDLYLKYGTYCKAFTSVMMQPSSVKVSMMHSNNPRIHHSIKWINTTPMIISEKYKK